ncbi:hypothetical protein BKA59DRAFT_455006 [Fusarium tricinctum]|uniref:Uncharacterized protein n=1 Tax=Fusarium tricinctum TaxID=61284 RepID=A0A8K0WD03_9HYPO|nr:hypothetical protein BKA59DRAFT_455006 [Fusarium tricinctum]
MSDIPTDADELSSSFYFPDPLTALTFFNDDLTERAVQSDEGFVVDHNEAIDESTIPSSYITTFQVQPFSPLIESDNTDEATSTSQRSSGSNIGDFGEDSSSEQTLSPSTPKDSKTSSSPNSPVIYSSSADSDSDDNDSQETRPNLFIHHYRHKRNMSKLKAEASIKHVKAKVAVELTPNLPSYHVYQLSGPLHARQLVKCREQYRQELRAFRWNAVNLFRSSEVPGSADYKAELAEYRRLRWRYISNEPTPQQRRHSQQLHKRLAQIKKSREEVARKRRVT